MCCGSELGWAAALLAGGGNLGKINLHRDRGRLGWWGAGGANISQGLLR